MNYNWSEVVNKFNTTPFLFVGSGLTRRYLGLPSWSELLQHFANIISDDQFAFQRYMSLYNSNFEQIGSAIEKDFNEKWFSTPEIRTESADVLSLVKNNVSPFKAEVAYYIKSVSNLNPAYAEEVSLLTKLTEKNISGFITTNYDTFLEDITTGYRTYNSQEDLIFSPIQEMAEIFKIHGSITTPESIVITSEDYKAFDDRCSYLAAKLLTIFMEYPIIFIGYSLNDNNIQKILSSIVGCLSKRNIDKLQDRFIFVKHNASITDDIKIGTHSQLINGQNLYMTQLETDNFKLVFEALQGKRSGLPLRVLRFLKEQFYNYTVTNTPSKHIYVNEYDPSVPDDQICFSIGRNSQLVKNGLKGLSAEQCYKAIVFDNYIPYSADDILEYAIPDLLTQYQRLPLFKFCKMASFPHPEILEKIKVNTFDDLISNSLKKYRLSKSFQDRSVNGIIKEYTIGNKFDTRALEYIACLCEDEIDIEQLQLFLHKFLTENPEILSKTFTNQTIKTNLRRLIRILDFLKYHN